jgi:hypothetical protein
VTVARPEEIPMNGVIKASVALAVAVFVVSVLFALGGLYNPLFGIVFLVVAIVLTVGCIFWALNQTADENGYGKQFLNVVVFGLIAGVLVFAFSMLNLKVLFPDYLAERSTAVIEWLEGMDMPAETLQAQIDKIESATPTRESLNGGIGAFVTSLVVGAVVAIFKRKK